MKIVNVYNYCRRFFKTNSMKIVNVYNCCRRFFQTNNLNCRQSIVGYSNNFDEYINNFGLKKVEKKDKFGNEITNEKLTVYRNY